jgi:hypothetical protein
MGIPAEIEIAYPELTETLLFQSGLIYCPLARASKSFASCHLESVNL